MVAVVVAIISALGMLGQLGKSAASGVELIGGLMGGVVGIGFLYRMIAGPEEKSTQGED